MQVTLFALSKYYALIWVVTVLLLGVLAYYMEVSGHSRNSAELRYMAKEYAFTCLGLFFLALYFLLWRVFVESHYIVDDDASKISLVVTILKLLGCFLWFDAISFWHHYIMHIKYPINIYAMAHRFHHLFREPSAFGTYSINPIEAMLQFVMVKCIQFILPVEPCYLDFVYTTQVVFAFMGHLTDLGYGKVFQCWQDPENNLGTWWNTNEMHRLHHLYVRCNYSVSLLSYWDWILGTTKVSKSSKTEQPKAAAVCVTKENECVSLHIAMCSSSDAVQNSIELPIKVE